MSGSYLSFSIAHKASGETDPTGLVSEIRQFLEDELGQDDSSPNVDSDSIESYGYFSIDSERQYYEETWRLVVRAYADDTSARAEVLTEVIGDDGESKDTQYPRVKGVSPRFVPRLAERYVCTIGTHRIGERPTPQSPSEFEGLLFDKDRKIPVLLVSRAPFGEFPFGGPEDLAQELLGRVLVVLVPQGDKLRRLGYQFNVRDGSSRIVWPGASQNYVGGKGVYFRTPPGDARQFATRVLKETDGMAMEAIRREFESGYIRSRMNCLELRNAEYLRQSGDAAEKPDLTDADRELTRERRKARKAKDNLGRQSARAEKTDRELSETQALLETAHWDIRRLEEERDTALGKGAAEAERKSRRTIAKLGKELEQERSESARLRSIAETETTSVSDDAKRFTIYSTKKNTQQLTVLNHAFNLMRDPSRDYIMRALSMRYQENEIESRVSRCVRLDTGSAASKLKADPKSFMDITNFEYIVSAERECFGGDTDLPRRLREIREHRNRVIHPDYNASTTRGMTIRTLNNITKTLKLMGAVKESNEVRELIAAV